MYKIDLHTHSVASKDGGLKRSQYVELLENGVLDVVAITDHNTIELAKDLYKDYPDSLIIGEEIMTAQGEIIGLYLSSDIEPGMTALETAKEIRGQGGLVYIPHPFETVRHGIQPDALDEIKYLVDIIEINNGRALLKSHLPKVAIWAKINRVATASSSDAHGLKGVGNSYSTVSKKPTKDTLVELLATARIVAERPPLRTLLYPKGHRLRKMMVLKK